MKLFERTRAGVTLTEAGKLLYDRTENILSYVRSTELEVSKAGKKQVLRIGITPTTVTTIMPYISRFSRENCDIFCVCDDPRDAMLWVQEGLATAVFPRSMEDLCTDLPIRIIEEEKLKTRILLAWKKDRRPSAVMQDFINICEKYAGNPAI